MQVEPRCPMCGNGRGRIHRVTTVPGYKDIVVVDRFCDSCSHEWRRDLQLLFTDDVTIVPTTKPE